MTAAILHLGALIDQQAAVVRGWIDGRPLGPVVVMLLVFCVCIGFASREGQ